MDFSQKSRLTCTNLLDPQPLGSAPDIHSTDVKTSLVSSPEYQGNLLQQNDPQTLALDGDGTNVVPFLPKGGSGEMNYGTNPIDQIQQGVQNIEDSFQGWLDDSKWKNQKEPQCADREIPFKPGKKLQMWAFCCQKAATYRPSPLRFQGDEEQRRLSFIGRQVDCDRCTYFSFQFHHIL